MSARRSRVCPLLHYRNKTHLHRFFTWTFPDFMNEESFIINQIFLYELSSVQWTHYNFFLGWMTIQIIDIHFEYTEMQRFGSRSGLIRKVFFLSSRVGSSQDHPGSSTMLEKVLMNQYCFLFFLNHAVFLTVERLPGLQAWTWQVRGLSQAENY